MRIQSISRNLAIGAGFAVLALLAADGRAQQPKAEGDLKAFQGEWVSTGKDGSQESHWTFQGNKLTLKTPTRNYRMAIELVPAKDPEKAINFRVADDSPSSPGAFVRGIYRFNSKEALEIAVSDKEGLRPTEFKADPGGTVGETERVFHFRLKRPKE